MLLTDVGCCGVGGASQDSAGFGPMEEGLISREGRNLHSLFRSQLKMLALGRAVYFVP